MNTQNVGKRTAGWVRSLSLLVGATIIGLTAMAGTATAAPRTLQKATVDYRDLNLTEKKDVTILYQRIQNAARQVCVVVDSKRLSAKARFDECRAQAVQAAVQDVGSNALIQLHNARVGSGTPALVLSAR